jgi:hypothetical protein
LICAEVALYIDGKVVAETARLQKQSGAGHSPSAAMKKTSAALL